MSISWAIWDRSSSERLLSPSLATFSTTEPGTLRPTASKDSSLINSRMGRYRPKSNLHVFSQSTASKKEVSSSRSELHWSSTSWYEAWNISMPTNKSGHFSKRALRILSCTVWCAWQGWASPMYTIRTVSRSARSSSKETTTPVSGRTMVPGLNPSETPLIRISVGILCFWIALQPAT